MNQHPSGTQIVHEIEVALARCSNRDVSKLSQSFRVIDFLDTQRHKIERAEWSPQSFYLDRMALSWSKAWREAPDAARAQVSECFSNMGVRIRHAEQMKSLWGQVQEVRAHLGEALPDVSGMVRTTVDFAARLTRRRVDETPQVTPSSKPAPR